MERKKWLEGAIHTFISNNEGVDSVDIVYRYRISAEITLSSLNELVKDGKVERRHTSGLNYGYFIK